MFGVIFKNTENCILIPEQSLFNFFFYKNQVSSSIEKIQNSIF